ncbi:hypothetical protein H072_8723 [Dactylellina haptotyla CBS 200.50]|uniref:Uncharacterized protein n=1 Tax=Dactylellina haptotyla (strain CBS 200.50) TaxID=1284197 RepID=S8A3I6_DACHA|nr:hypothetical protein H072_8723 [Dactylellina haptotyla CBS 200.50]
MSLLDQDIPTAINTCSRCSMLMVHSQPASRARPHFHDRYCDASPQNDGPRRITVYVNPSKRPYVAPFRRVQTLERLLQYVATLPHPHIRFITSANPAQPKYKACEERLFSGQWQLVDRSGCIIRPEDWEELVHDGMDITIDTTCYEQPQEVSEERMPVMEPTMFSVPKNIPREISQQNEVAGDLMDIQSAMDSTDAQRHQHHQSDASARGYGGGPSNLFIPVYQEAPIATELAVEEDPEPQIPLQNVFVMPPKPSLVTPKPKLWSPIKKNSNMSASALEFRPVGMSSSALPLESPLFQIRQSTSKRSMAIPILKPPTPPLTIIAAPKADVPDTAEAFEAGDGWSDRVAVTAELTDDAMRHDSPPQDNGAWEGEASVISIPERERLLPVVESSKSPLVEPEDPEETRPVPEMIIESGPEYQALPTESNSGTQSRDDITQTVDEIDHPETDHESPEDGPESKYDGESHLFDDEVIYSASRTPEPGNTQSAVNLNNDETPIAAENMEHEEQTVIEVPLEQALLEPTPEPSTTLENIVLEEITADETVSKAPVLEPELPRTSIEDNFLPDTASEDLNVGNYPREETDPTRVALPSPTPPASEPFVTKVDPSAQEFKPRLEPLRLTTGFKWDEEPMPEPIPEPKPKPQLEPMVEPKEPVTAEKALDPTSTASSWETSAWGSNETAASGSGWNDWSTGNTATNINDQWDDRGHVPLPEDNSEWAPKTRKPVLVEAAPPEKLAWRGNAGGLQKSAWAAVASPTSSKPPLAPKKATPIPNATPSKAMSASPKSAGPDWRSQKSTPADTYYVHFLPSPWCPQANPKPTKVSVGGSTSIRKLTQMYAKHYKDSRLLSIANNFMQNAIFEYSISMSEDGMVTPAMLDAERKLRDCDFESSEFWVSIVYSGRQAAPPKKA